MDQLDLVCGRKHSFHAGLKTVVAVPHPQIPALVMTRPTWYPTLIFASMISSLKQSCSEQAINILPFRDLLIPKLLSFPYQHTSESCCMSPFWRILLRRLMDHHLNIFRNPIPFSCCILKFLAISQIVLWGSGRGVAWSSLWFPETTWNGMG